MRARARVCIIVIRVRITSTEIGVCEKERASERGEGELASE